MKNVIILLLLFAVSLNLQSQTYEPSPFNFVWSADSVAKPFEPDSFAVNEFLLGFQWSGSPRMNKALRFNANAGGYYELEADEINDDDLINLISQPSSDAHNGTHLKVGNSAMVHFEPTLLHLYNLPYKHKQDSTNAIFPFLLNYGTRLPIDSINTDNYNRVLFFKDSMNTYPSDSINLKAILPNRGFITKNFGGQLGGYDGTNWNLSINLRRLNPDIDQDFNPLDTILTIQMPYVAITSAGDTLDKFINFDQLPKSNIPSDTLSLGTLQYMGYAMDVEPNIVLTNKLVITENMLDTNRLSPDITISAHFKLSSDSTLTYPENTRYNPFFKPGLEVGESELINSFDIQVKYHGNLDVAVDWVRIENDASQDLWRGEHDLHNKTVLQSFVDTIPKIKIGGNEVYKIHRFYGQDVESDNFVWWGQLRYFNLFTNGMAVTRDIPNAPEAYKLYTRAPNRYLGMSFNRYENYLATPAVRQAVGGHDWKYMGYKYGFRGEQPSDSLTSGYETFFTNGSIASDYDIFNDIKNYDIEDYIGHMLASNSLQTEWELELYKMFVWNENYEIGKQAIERHNYLYLDQPWYMNLFVGANIAKEVLSTSGLVSNPNNHVAKFSTLRPKTSEEIRLLMNTNVIFGAKGIIMDREEPNGLDYNIFLGLGDGRKSVEFDTDSLYKFIQNDTLGGDFAGGISDIYNYKDYIVPDTLSKYLEIAPDRIYTGVKSTRTEVYKQATWIRAVDSILVNLRMMATYMEGFKTFEHQNPFNGYKHWDENPLDHVIDLYGIRTRKIFEPKYNLAHNTNPDFEHIDSSFFDITLLQYKGDTPRSLYNQKKSTYIGIQNRRTDPLIFVEKELFWPVFDKSLMFFSSSEFDDLVRNGGEDLWGEHHNSSWWQDQWWKRLGIRELNIPVKNPVHGNGTYLVVEELIVDNLESLGWWFDDDYYHKIDTLLSDGDTLKAKLLPGQGKILEFKNVPYFFNDPTKDTIPDNDSCYFCDIYNDFDLFEFQVEKIGGEFEGCCYDISLTYNGNCSFDDIPLRLLFEGESGNTFSSPSQPWLVKDSSGTNIRYKDFEFDLDSTTGTIDLGTFCISDSSNEYTISLLAGKDKGTKFVGCNREMTFKAECDGVEDVIDCCEGLAVSDSMYVDGYTVFNGDSIPELFCTVWNIDPLYDSDCIYGVTLGDGDVNKTLIPVGGLPIDFSLPGIGVFGSCSPYVSCSQTASPEGDIRYVKMKFLGKDGTTVCELDVPIWLPCSGSTLDDVIIEEPFIKKTSEKDKSVKSYKFDNLTLNLWPNPAQNELNLEINSKLSGNANISLINNLGQSVNLYQNYSLSQGLNNLNINLTDVRQGVYYIQILKDGNKVTVPFVITK